MTWPRTTVIGSAAICCSRTRRITSALLEKGLGMAGHLVALDADALGLEGQDHLVHVQQGLVERRAAQPGRAAHRRVEEFDGRTGVAGAAACRRSKQRSLVCRLMT